MNMKTLSLISIFTFGLAAVLVAADAKPLYENNFEKADVGKVPEDFLVLDGGFVVKEESGNKFLELPGAPLDNFGVLFGPTETANVAVSARIHGTGKGRRFPAFGVGLNGVGGYKIQITPAKKVIELFKGEDVVASAPYTWESDAWTMLRLQVRKVKEGEFVMEGKAWKQGAEEPKAWIISHPEKGEITAGRASVWGNPFSGTPIRFDDLQVQRVSDK